MLRKRRRGGWYVGKLEMLKGGGVFRDHPVRFDTLLGSVHLAVMSLRERTKRGRKPTYAVTSSACAIYQATRRSANDARESLSSMASLLSASGFHLMRPKNSISSSAIASTAESVILSSVFCILVFT
jgi:hypothetical protein